MFLKHSKIQIVIFTHLRNFMFPPCPLRMLTTGEERDVWVAANFTRRALPEEGAKKLLPWYFRRKEERERYV